MATTHQSAAVGTTSVADRYEFDGGYPTPETVPDRHFLVALRLYGTASSSTKHGSPTTS